jgi:hypothetical protein
MTPIPHAKIGKIHLKPAFIRKKHLGPVTGPQMRNKLAVIAELTRDRQQAGRVGK